MNNPKFKFGNPEAWVLAGQCRNKRMCYNDMEAAARAAFPDNTHDVLVAHREIGYLSDRYSDKFRNRIVRRLPDRMVLPFYLRPSYRNEFVQNKNRFIPDIDYREAAVAAQPYGPIKSMKDELHVKRIKFAREHFQGLIRWPSDIQTRESKIVIVKTWDDFSFKIDSGKPGLPREHCALKLFIQAPLDFFKHDFYGFGEHLIVQRLEQYDMDDGTRVLKTLSIDRDNLYDNKFNVLKERWYVQKEQARGTALTLDGALKSMMYFMGKDILGAMNGV